MELKINTSNWKYIFPLLYGPYKLISGIPGWFKRTWKAIDWEKVIVFVVLIAALAVGFFGSIFLFVWCIMNGHYIWPLVIVNAWVAFIWWMERIPYNGDSKD